MKRKVLLLLVTAFALVGTLALPGCSVDSRTIDRAFELLGEGYEDESEDYESEPEPSNEGATRDDNDQAEKTNAAIEEDGTYTSKDDVALYLHTYGHLPDNYITKDEAEDEGWKTGGLSLGEACPGMSIGGDRFGNREGKLPKASGRTWYECDIDYHGGKSRGTKRIVYSNDGLIYYTGDHYKSFERLY